MDHLQDQIEELKNSLLGLIEIIQDNCEEEEQEETETHQASPEMQLFFEKLLALKNKCKNKKEEACRLTSLWNEEAKIYEEIYHELDGIIKENQ